MSHLRYLYRRLGGIYAVRICILACFKFRFGQPRDSRFNKSSLTGSRRRHSLSGRLLRKRLFLKRDGVVQSTSERRAQQPIEAPGMMDQSALTSSKRWFSVS
jgi:hypothetical protein